MRELERLKRQRAEEQMAREREAARVEALEREEAVLRGNPLLAEPVSVPMKRRCVDPRAWSAKRYGLIR